MGARSIPFHSLAWKLCKPRELVHVVKFIERKEKTILSYLFMLYNFLDFRHVEKLANKILEWEWEGYMPLCTCRFASEIFNRKQFALPCIWLGDHYNCLEQFQCDNVIVPWKLWEISLSLLLYINRTKEYSFHKKSYTGLL